MRWGVELEGDRCEVLTSPNPDPDVVIGTDSATWIELREGTLSGLDAFRSRRLWARGHLDLAIAFEGFFRLPNGRPPLLRVHSVDAGKAKISSLTAGQRPRDRCPDPRSRRHQVELLRDGLGAGARLHGALDRPPRVRRLLEAGARGVRPRLVRALGGPLPRRDEDPPRPPGRQLARRAGGDRGRARRAGAGREPQPALPLARVAQAPALRPGREAAAARAGGDPPQDERPSRPAPVLGHVRPTRPAPPLGRRRRRRGVPRRLSQPRCPGRLLLRRPHHLPRGAARPTASGRGSRGSSRRRCSSGETRTRSSRSPSAAT